MGLAVSISRDGPPSEARQDLSLLVAAMASEIGAVATEPQVRGFFVAVGRRLAAHADMTEVTNIALMTARVNTFWAGMGWGSAHIAMAGNALVIQHSGMPEVLDGDTEGRWPTIAAAVLEGAYDAWLRAVGSGQMLNTQVISWRNGTVELRHGR